MVSFISFILIIVIILLLTQGHFIEMAVSEGSLYRSRIHCYFLDQSRVVRPPATERNYHIFYQMMAGLNTDERTQLGLASLGVSDLHYLTRGNSILDTEEEKERFLEWKINMAVLGIPFLDVVRVLSAVLLLGNVHFRSGTEAKLEIQGNEELLAVARLIGVKSDLLIKGLTTRTHNVRGQLIKTYSDPYLVSYIYYLSFIYLSII